MVNVNAFAGVLEVLTGEAQPTFNNDVDVLNYALTLEHLENEFYKQVLASGRLQGNAASYLRTIGAHEQAHVDAIIPVIRQLGGTPVALPNFDFGTVPNNPSAIVEFFQTVEAVGASAYLGAVPSISNPDILEAALSIHAVEAEHASALADLVAPGTDLFAPEAFATPLTPDEVLRIVAPFFGGMAMPRTGGGYGAGTGEIDQIVR